ncbi:MAG: cyclase family protein [Halobellus sp.]
MSRDGGAPTPDGRVIEPHATHADDGYRASRIDLGSHAGTHVDAPAHTEPDGAPARAFARRRSVHPPAAVAVRRTPGENRRDSGLIRIKLRQNGRKPGRTAVHGRPGLGTSGSFVRVRIDDETNNDTRRRARGARRRDGCGGRGARKHSPVRRRSRGRARAGTVGCRRGG